jgi:hypothetical protein
MKNKIPESENIILEQLKDFFPLPPYDLGFDCRNIILETSLVIEKSTSLFLAFLLGIKDLEQSITLGNKSSSFSLKQKIDLLIDIGALNSNDKKKFQSFMEIRNIFMHNFHANSFTNCFKFLDGKDKFLIKTYGVDEKISEEESFNAICVKLADEVLILTIGIIDRVLLIRVNENISSLKDKIIELFTEFHKNKLKNDQIQ